MSRLLRLGSLRRLQVVMGLALMALVFAPSASGAAPLDTVTVTGSTFASPGISPISAIDIHAQSGTSGQNPSGSVQFTVGGSIFVSGPVTCLSVTGPDQGGGISTAPTTAILGFDDQTFLHAIQTFKIVDNGGNGADTMSAVSIGGRAPSDCSPASPPVSPPLTLTNGRAVVFDAPVLPTTKAQCKNGGWQNYQQFKNQGQCVVFVVKQARQGCVAERGRIGRTAFRAKYGLGRYHLLALRRCVNAAAR
jgi:hypothetical protein